MDTAEDVPSYRRPKGPEPDTVRRMERITALRAAGRTFRSIADELGISRQRVHQLVSRREDGTQYIGPYKNGYERRRRQKGHR